MLTGETIDAATALPIHLVNKVVGHETLMQAARDFAEKIAANPALTLRMSKRLLRESQHVSLATSLEIAAASQALAHFTQDDDEAVLAFIDKRPPKFTGL